MNWLIKKFGCIFGLILSLNIFASNSMKDTQWNPCHLRHLNVKTLDDVRVTTSALNLVNNVISVANGDIEKELEVLINNLNNETHMFIKYLVLSLSKSSSTNSLSSFSSSSSSSSSSSPSSSSSSSSSSSLEADDFDSNSQATKIKVSFASNFSSLNVKDQHPSSKDSSFKTAISSTSLLLDAEEVRLVDAKAAETNHSQPPSPQNANEGVFIDSAELSQLLHLCLTRNLAFQQEDVIFSYFKSTGRIFFADYLRTNTNNTNSKIKDCVTSSVVRSCQPRFEHSLRQATQKLSHSLKIYHVVSSTLSTMKEILAELSNQVSSDKPLVQQLTRMVLCTPICKQLLHHDKTLSKDGISKNKTSIPQMSPKTVELAALKKHKREYSLDKDQIDIKAAISSTNDSHQINANAFSNTNRQFTNSSAANASLEGSLLCSKDTTHKGALQSVPLCKSHCKSLVQGVLDSVLVKYVARLKLLAERVKEFFLILNWVAEDDKDHNEFRLFLSKFQLVFEDAWSCAKKSYFSCDQTQQQQPNQFPSSSSSSTSSSSSPSSSFSSFRPKSMRQNLQMLTRMMTLFLERLAMLADDVCSADVMLTYDDAANDDADDNCWKKGSDDALNVLSKIKTSKGFIISEKSKATKSKSKNNNEERISDNINTNIKILRQLKLNEMQWIASDEDTMADQEQSGDDLTSGGSGSGSSWDNDVNFRIVSDPSSQALSSTTSKPHHLSTASHINKENPRTTSAHPSTHHPSTSSKSVIQKVQKEENKLIFQNVLSLSPKLSVCGVLCYLTALVVFL